MLVAEAGGEKRRWHERDEDTGGGRAGLLDSVGNGTEDGETEMRLSGLPGICSTDYLGSYLSGRVVSFPKRSFLGLIGREGEREAVRDGDSYHNQ